MTTMVDGHAPAPPVRDDEEERLEKDEDGKEEGGGGGRHVEINVNGASAADDAADVSGPSSSAAIEYDDDFATAAAAAAEAAALSATRKGRALASRGAGLMGKMGKSRAGTVSGMFGTTPRTIMMPKLFSESTAAGKTVDGGGGGAGGGGGDGGGDEGRAGALSGTPNKGATVLGRRSSFGKIGRGGSLGGSPLAQKARLVVEVLEVREMFTSHIKRGAGTDDDVGAAGVGLGPSTASSSSLGATVDADVGAGTSSAEEAYVLVRLDHRRRTWPTATTAARRRQTTTKFEERLYFDISSDDLGSVALVFEFWQNLPTEPATPSPPVPSTGHIDKTSSSDVKDGKMKKESGSNASSTATKEGTIDSTPTLALDKGRQPPITSPPDGRQVQASQPAGETASLESPQPPLPSSNDCLSTTPAAASSVHGMDEVAPKGEGGDGVTRGRVGGGYGFSAGQSLMQRMGTAASATRRRRKGAGTGTTGGLGSRWKRAVGGGGGGTAAGGQRCTLLGHARLELRSSVSHEWIAMEVVDDRDALTGMAMRVSTHVGFGFGRVLDGGDNPTRSTGLRSIAAGGKGGGGKGGGGKVGMGSGGATGKVAALGAAAARGKVDDELTGREVLRGVVGMAGGVAVFDAYGILIEPNMVADFQVAGGLRRCYDSLRHKRWTAALESMNIAGDSSSPVANQKLPPLSPSPAPPSPSPLSSPSLSNIKTGGNQRDKTSWNVDIDWRRLRGASQHTQVRSLIWGGIPTHLRTKAYAAFADMDGYPGTGGGGFGDDDDDEEVFEVAASASRGAGMVGAGGVISSAASMSSSSFSSSVYCPSPSEGAVSKKGGGRRRRRRMDRRGHRLSARPEAAAPSSQYKRAVVAAAKSLSAATEQIERDITRTVSNRHRTFVNAPDGQATLRRVLGAYAVMYPRMGYCQAMNYLAAQLLFIMPEEQAFWTLSYICDGLCPGYYVPSMQGLLVDMQVVENLLKTRLPNLMAHVEAQSCPVTIFTSQWLISLCVNAFHTELAFRVLDVLLCEGIPALYAVIVAFFRLHEAEILAIHDYDAQAILDYIKDAASAFFDDDILMAAAKDELEAWVMDLPTLVTGVRASMRPRLEDGVRKVAVQQLRRQLRLDDSAANDLYKEIRRHVSDDAGLGIMDFRVVSREGFAELVATVLPEVYYPRHALLFDVFDTDRRGALTLDKVVCFFGAMGGIQGRLPPSPEMIGEGKDDGERKGKASAAGGEVESANSSVDDASTIDRLVSLFLAFDADGDEKINLEDVCRMVKMARRLRTAPLYATAPAAVVAGRDEEQDEADGGDGDQADDAVLDGRAHGGGGHGNLDGVADIAACSTAAAATDDTIDEDEVHRNGLGTLAEGAVFGDDADRVKVERLWKTELDGDAPFVRCSDFCRFALRLPHVEAFVLLWPKVDDDES